MHQQQDQRPSTAAVPPPPAPPPLAARFPCDSHDLPTALPARRTDRRGSPRSRSHCTRPPHAPAMAACRTCRAQNSLVPIVVVIIINCVVVLLSTFTAIRPTHTHTHTHTSLCAPPPCTATATAAVVGCRRPSHTFYVSSVLSPGRWQVMGHD
jgi:hypothetical protein